MPLHTTPEKVPVLIILFAREDTTRRVFEAVSRYKPIKLYVAGDGPRADKPNEADKVARARATILNNIDWDCDVRTLFRDENLGCAKAVSGAISWFFENEMQGIILEDDCLPSNDFFDYCTKMLELYKDDTRIASVSGFNPLGNGVESGRVFFSRYTRVWGWASWRRAWKAFVDDAMDREPEVVIKMFGHRYGWLESHFAIKSFRKYYSMTEKTTWDYRWDAACMANSMLTIVPAANLVRNIGIGKLDSTNTNKGMGSVAEITYGKLAFPLQLPAFIHYDINEDKAMRRWRLRIKARSFITRVVTFGK